MMEANKKEEKAAKLRKEQMKPKKDGDQENGTIKEDVAVSEAGENEPEMKSVSTSKKPKR